MKYYKRNLFVMLALVLTILIAGCENSAEESSATVDNQSPNSDSSQNKNNESIYAEPTENASTTQSSETIINHSDSNDIFENVDATDKEPNQDKDDTTASLKEEYLKKLNDTKEELDAMEPIDSTTYALKKVEGDRYDAWDDLLNEVYVILIGQLSAEEMEELRQEQRKWIEYRDETAKKASLKYEGGTMEHLEYVSVLANLTEERCYELVEEYME